MRWVDMHGPSGPIVVLMSRHYARFCTLDSEDLIQEAHLAWLQRRSGNTVAVAWTAMSNAAARDRRQSRPLPFPIDRDCDSSRDDLLDLPVYLSRLNTTQRTVIDLLYFDGLSVEETARRCGLSTSSVKYHRSHALTVMRGDEPLPPKLGRYRFSRKQTASGWRRPLKRCRA